MMCDLTRTGPYSPFAFPVCSVACGLPQEAGAVPEDSMTLPVSMTEEDEMYLLYATGDSMIGAGIQAGDMVLVRR